MAKVPTGGTIRWYGPPMNSQTKGNPHPDQVEVKVTYHAEVVAAVQKAAEQIAADARFKLAAHRDTGDATIGVFHRGTAGQLLDSVVYLQASDSNGKDGPKLKPQDAARAAWAIEHGWTTEDGTEVPAVGPLHYAIDKAGGKL